MIDSMKVKRSIYFAATLQGYVILKPSCIIELQNLISSEQNKNNVIQLKKKYLNLTKASNSPNYYVVIYAKIYMSVKMIVVRRTFDFCSISAKT